MPVTDFDCSKNFGLKRGRRVYLPFGWEPVIDVRWGMGDALDLGRSSPVPRGLTLASDRRSWNSSGHTSRVCKLQVVSAVSSRRLGTVFITGCHSFGCLTWNRSPKWHSSAEHNYASPYVLGSVCSRDPHVTMFRQPPVMCIPSRGRHGLEPIVILRVAPCQI